MPLLLGAAVEAAALGGAEGVGMGFLVSSEVMNAYDSESSDESDEDEDEDEGPDSVKRGVVRGVSNGDDGEVRFEAGTGVIGGTAGAVEVAFDGFDVVVDEVEDAVFVGALLSLCTCGVAVVVVVVESDLIDALIGTLAVEDVTGVVAVTGVARGGVAGVALEDDVEEEGVEVA
jgi:hypothetical protein